MNKLKGVAPTVPSRIVSHPSLDPPHGHPAILLAGQLVSLIYSVKVLCYKAAGEVEAFSWGGQKSR